MTDIAYDTEFLENGREIRLISIGMVAPGEQYYAINMDPRIITDAVNHEWLRENVIPSLPVIVHGPSASIRNSAGDRYDWRWDYDHKDFSAVKSRSVIASEVGRLITAFRDPVLWAYYAAYDYVALCQLWGRMIDLPRGVPMWTNDLKQEAQRLGNPELPDYAGLTRHDALSDAIEVMERLQFLREVDAEQQRNREVAIMDASRRRPSADVITELKGEQR